MRKDHDFLVSAPGIPYLTVTIRGGWTMAQRDPGKTRRKGLTLLQVADMFDDEAKAEAWIAERRWPNGPHCPDCGSFHVQSGIKHKTMTHRYRDCDGRPMFTLRKGTVTEGSKSPYRAWAIAICLYTTNLKGVSSMKLHRELGISPKAARFMLQRLRKAAKMDAGLFPARSRPTGRMRAASAQTCRTPGAGSRPPPKPGAARSARRPSSASGIAGRRRSGQRSSGTPASRLSEASSTGRLVEGTGGKRLTRREPAAPNGLPSGTRGT